MKKIIRYENLRSFAYSSDALVRGPIKGVVIDFMGLNGAAMWTDDAPPEWAPVLAEKGIVLIVPYLDPWNWMNDRAIRTVEAILAALREGRGLREDLPVVASGGSMGGLCALVFTRYAKRTPAACVVNCPVCDLPFHYTERPDLPRTLYAAFGGEETPLAQAIEAHSPLHLAASMPDTAYHVFHCEADRAVNIRSHSEKFVEAMRDHRRIEYVTVPGRDHCDLTEEARALYRRRAKEAILNR